MLGENQKHSVGTEKQSVETAQSVVGDYDWKPLETFEREISPFVHKVAGQREIDMGPVPRRWPEDGIIHIDRGLIWAFGQNRYEAIAAPLLLVSFWAFITLSWWLTILIERRIPGIAGILLSWLVFGATVFIFRWLLLLLTEFVFSFLETMLAARRNARKKEHDYE
ncbi:MAG TPA: hypothetical protein VF553_14495 [Pyrinomonadaceae bacterium]|jgi:hypothetical protein